LTLGQIEGMVQAAARENMAPIQALRDAVTASQRLHALLIGKVGSDRAVDLRPLTDMLKGVAQVCAAAVPPPAAAAPDQAEEGAAPGAAESAGPRESGAIRTREDASRLLDRVCEFIERTEPANPAPLFIRRAQRLMAKNFVDIIQELAPDALKAIQQLTGMEAPKK